MKTNMYLIGVDIDIYNFLSYKAQLSSKWKVISEYLMDSPKFKEDFGTYFALPRVKPRLLTIGKKREVDKNEDKENES